MLPFIIAARRAKVRIMAHRRLISSSFQPHTHTQMRTYFMFHLAYPRHYPTADVTRAIKPLCHPAVRDKADLPSTFQQKH